MTIVEYFNQRIPQILPAVRKMWNSGGFDDDTQSKYFTDLLAGQYAKTNNEVGNPEHATVKSENIKATLTEEAVEHVILEQIADELGIEISDLQEALKEARLQEPVTMPAKLYRGIKLDHATRHGDPEKVGFENVDAFTGGKDKVVFVTSEPAVAASYARKAKFDRSSGELETKPLNFGDYIYEIDTTGLDPTLFAMDDTSTPGEILYGPQYMYKGAIPQEEIIITDQSGTQRKIPRIRKSHYLSDGLLKDVYVKPHLLSAVHKRF